MSKRPRDDDGHRPPKRQKPEKKGQTSEVEEVHTARQLRQLLAFKQDELQQLRDGIAAFKAFLERILYSQDIEDRGRHLSILREFLDEQKPADANDIERPFLNQLWQAWSFAISDHNDSLSSSVAAILALLLKALSSLLDLRDHGILLCRTVLQHQHLRLAKKCLDAPRQKEHVISPALRLLTEVVNFDGGMFAREMYKRRDDTFEVGMLRRNLGIVNADTEEGTFRHPAIRTSTIRYIISYFKYLHEGGKVDILKSRPLCVALFGHLRDDPNEIIDELLAVTELHILKDSELPRSAKSGLLLQQNLQRVTEVAARSSEGSPSSSTAFQWLKSVATKPSYGILRAAGWYPPGTTKFDQSNANVHTIDLGLDSLSFYDGTGVPEVRNTTLLGWAKTLRAHSSEVERDLLLTCFGTAPEIVAPYFMDMNIQLDPKLSNTWIGYASLIFEAVDLSTPAYLGHENSWASLPPQTNIMIENILPRCLNQKVLTRCLNQNSELITFFATRILISAIEKLSRMRTLMSEGAEASAGHATLWHEASERLLARITERCPKMRDVIATFRKIPDDDEHALQREAVTRLLKLYYDVLPLEAMEEQFDISSPLTAALIRSQTVENSSERSQVRQLELQHLLQIAQKNPGIRWFTKQGSLDYSPLVTLLRLHRRDCQNSQIRDLIGHILFENSILSDDKPLRALVASTLELNDESDGSVWAFIDDCLLRGYRKPVKYLDDVDDLINTSTAENPVSQSAGQACLLIPILLEQVPFVLDKKDSSRIMQWVEFFSDCLHHIDIDYRDITCILQAKLSNMPGWRKPQSLSAAVEKGVSMAQISQPTAELKRPDNLSRRDQDTEIPFQACPAESPDHPELFKWARKELDLALEDGDIEALILCLCSQYPEIRSQALMQLHKLESVLQTTNIDDKDPIYVLVGELLETYEQHLSDKSDPLSYVAGTFATHALRVQMDPTHHMYPKINRYLNRGPEWRINRLPVHWLETTVLNRPDDADAYWREVQWVLDWLVDCLRTSADVEVLRRGGVFERLMSIFASPAAAYHKTVRELVLEILWRCTTIEGGSTTLITRTGVLSWLDMMTRKEHSEIEIGVKRALLESCDRNKVEEWLAMDFDLL